MNHEIQIRQAVIHILDSMKGEPILSDVEINFGSEFAEFLKHHVSRILFTDDSKSCQFFDQSEIYQMLRTFAQDQFIEHSQEIAQLLYVIMNSNIDIPAGDLIVTTFRAEEEDYIAILKMNYKEFYTHRSFDADGGTGNDIVRHNAILPNRVRNSRKLLLSD